jgi:YbgC/YbaW family acyl-CoA thioester hydrolase
MNLIFRLWFLIATARWRTRVPALGSCASHFRVLPNDLDVLRHMNNGRYFSILDLARVDLMARSGLWQKLKKQGWYPVVVEESLTFRRSLKVFDCYEVRTKVIDWDDKHIIMKQTFWRHEVEIASGIVKARFLKISGGSVLTADLFKLAGISSEQSNSTLD